MRALLTLSLLLLPMMAMANQPPPPPEGGLTPIHDTECMDIMTNVDGHCYLSRDIDGNIYLAFFQNDEIMFIREIRPEGAYVTIWMSDKFDTF